MYNNIHLSSSILSSFQLHGQAVLNSFCHNIDSHRNGSGIRDEFIISIIYPCCLRHILLHCILIWEMFPTLWICYRCYDILHGHPFASFFVYYVLFSSLFCYMVFGSHFETGMPGPDCHISLSALALRPCFTLRLDSLLHIHIERTAFTQHFASKT